MSPEEMRIEVAKSSGWNHVHWNGPGSEPFGDNPNGNKSDRAYDHLPNYPGDLNACHEMEKALSFDELTDYETRVLNEVIRDGGTWRPALCATAEQRCRAYLKTKNLWKP